MVGIRRTIEENREVFLPSRMAVLIDTAPSPWQVDPEIKRLNKLLIEPSPENREKAFWMSSVAVSFTRMTSAAIVGDGVKVNLKNKKAEKIIKKWNRKINVKRETIEDWMERTWFDCIVHGKGFDRVEPDNIEYENVDIQRLDPKTIKILEDPVYGWRKFEQFIEKFKHHRTKKQFYRKAGIEHYELLPHEQDKVYYGDGRTRFSSRGVKELQIHIPDEPDRMLFVNFFQVPPISAAVKFIVYKIWILYFMRKYSQKYWAPFVVAKVGDPKQNNYPTDPAIMQQSINKISKIVKNMTAFGYLTVPGDVEVETLETNTARSAEIYPMYIRELDKQIMYAIFGSMGQREASGNELATSRVLEKGWLRFIKGIRRKYELILANFYAECLLPYNGIKNVDPIDIDFEWSRLTLEEPREMMEAIKIGAEIGMWKNQNEMRKAAQAVFAFLEEVPEGSKLPPPPKDQGLEQIYEQYVKNEQ